jgi:hypothetical protein
MLRPNQFPSSAAVRYSRALPALLIGLLFALPGRTRPEASAPAASATGGVLLQAGHLVYEGAFRLPSGQLGSSTFDGGGKAMSFNPANGTLFIGGIGQQQIAEVNIPAIRTGGSLSDLDTATLRTPFRQVADVGLLNCSEAKLLGGTLPWMGELIVSGYCYFESGVETRSHWRVNGSTVAGPFQAGTAGAGFVSGWMTPIPSEWQGPLGGPALTGQGSIPIISRTSAGPAASVFNPADVGVRSPVPATQVLGYPMDHQTIGTADSNGTLYNTTQYMAGMVFPAGTSTVLFFAGRKALGQFCYGPGTTDQSLHMTTYPGAPLSETWCYDPVNLDKGTHGYPYAHFVYAYDANDLVAAKNGSKAPWEVMPYATWQFDVPFEYGQRVLEGVAYDPAAKRIFLTAGNGDTYKPLVHVFKVDAAASVTATPAPAPAPAPTPVADTSAPSVTITAPASGTVVTGSVMVGATASDNVAVAGVQFTLDGANLGGEDTSAPYQATWDTTMVSNGSHTLRATARDAAGNASSSAVTISVNNASTLSDTTAPTVTLTSPSADTIATGTMVLSATASDNVGVTAVQFTLNNVSLGEPVGAPFQMSWVTSTVPDGAYTLKAVARDAAGNSTQSASRQVTVSNAVTEESGSGDDGGNGGRKEGWSDGDGGRDRWDEDARGRVKPGRGRTANSDPSPNARPIASAEGAQTGAPATATRGSAARQAGRRDTSDTQPTPAGSTLECQGDNPYQSSAGRIGICVGGRWTPVLGIRTWGVVRQRSLPSGGTIWVIETDEALYDVHGGLADAYRKQDLEILFEGSFRTDLKSALEGASVLELRQINLP